jgi:phosphoglucosamine mutase
MKRLFGADGIRGIIDQYPFRAEDLARLGQSLAHWWLEDEKRPIILLGTDTRESNQRIKSPLVDGLTQAGVEVWDAGILPTSAISYLVASNPDLLGGVMVSASHNPIFENGLKVFNQAGAKLSDEHEHQIEELFFLPNLTFRFRKSPAQVRTKSDALHNYIHATVKKFEHLSYPKSKKILVDCANGASYFTTQAIFHKLGIHYTLHNIAPDGTNINFGVGSEYVRKFPRQFAEDVKHSDAMLGIAFDGDADRVVFVDRDGVFYDGDMLLSMLAPFLQERGLLNNSTVVITQMANSGLAAHLDTFKIQTRQVNNGDKYITDMLMQDNHTLGGEQIGHIIIRDDETHITGDSLNTTLWILSALFEQDCSLNELMRGMRKWPQINVSVGLGGRMISKTETIPGLDERKQQVMGKISDLSHFECRPASTEPVYRIMLEARETPVHVLTEHALALTNHIQQMLNKEGEPIEVLDCVRGGLITHLSRESQAAVY